MGILGNLDARMGKIGAGIAQGVSRARPGMSSGARSAASGATKAFRHGRVAAAGYISPAMGHRMLGYGAVAGTAALGYGAYKGYKGRRKSESAN